MHRRHALIEEAVVAAIALAIIGALIAAIFWFSTGRSPWPAVVIAEALAFGWGLILVVVTSPSWTR
jgi:formate/nitrite transporter FocA (FNT family)